MCWVVVVVLVVVVVVVVVVVGCCNELSHHIHQLSLSGHQLLHDIVVVGITTRRHL